MKAARAVATRGLTHLALSVRDPRLSYTFYRRVLGVCAVYEKPDGYVVEIWHELPTPMDPSPRARRGGKR